MKSLLLTVLIVAGVQSSLAGAQSARVWNFRAYLDDSAIGTHRFSLRQSGAESELLSEARFDVKLLFFTAYRYVHRANERWRGNCLVSMDSKTDDDGKPYSVSAERNPNDGCVMSFAYWNPEILRQSRLLNAQTGELEKVSVADLGDDSVRVRGSVVAAKRYRISGPKNPIDLWYSPAGEWLALDAALDGGRRLRYRIEQENPR